MSENFIKVNDMFEELREENNRLLNELLFANNCIEMFIEFKSFVDLNSIKFKVNLETNDLQKYEELSEKLNQIICEINLKSNFIDCTSIVKIEISEDKNNDNTEEDLHLSDNWINNVNDNLFICNSDPNEDFNRLLEEPEDKALTSNQMAFDMNYVSDTEEEDNNEDNDQSKSAKFIQCRVNDCHRQFQRSTQLMKHISTEHPLLQTYVCPESKCSFRSSAKQLMREHLSAEHPDWCPTQDNGCDKPLRCPFSFCNKTFAAHNGLGYHVDSVHYQTEEFRCDWPGCQFMAFHQRYLNKHRLVHNDEYKYICDHPKCGKRFKRSNNLVQHKLIHQNERKFGCSWPGCHFRAKVNSTVKRHELIHTVDKPFACDWPLCKKTCNTKKSLEEHMRVHTGFRPFKCEWPQCSYRGYTKKNLDKHLSSHQRGTLKRKSELDNP